VLIDHGRSLKRAEEGIKPTAQFGPAAVGGERSARNATVRRAARSGSQRRISAPATSRRYGPRSTGATNHVCGWIGRASSAPTFSAAQTPGLAANRFSSRQLAVPTKIQRSETFLLERCGPRHGQKGRRPGGGALMGHDPCRRPVGWPSVDDGDAHVAMILSTMGVELVLL